MDNESTVNFTAKITKSDSASRIVWGWASVIEKDGESIFDHQGDRIAEDVLAKAAHDFVSDYRVGKVMHSGRKVGALVESVVFTKELQKALGIDLGKVGWFIGMRVSEDVFKRVESGELQAFSIGGIATKVAVE